MKPHQHKTWIELSRAHLINNVGAFRKHLGKKTQLMAVVKANAYGHGAGLVVPMMLKSGASWLGVDSVDEALEIEPVADEAPILILGYTPLSRLPEAARHGLRLTVYNPETVKALGSFAKRARKQIRLHIKCETGTTRQGVLFSDIIPFAKLIGSYPGLILEGLSTHFANIEDTADHSYATRQLLTFRRIYNMLENIGIRVPVRHTACTAAAILFPETHFNLARVGLGLYGLSPFIIPPLSEGRLGGVGRGWSKNSLLPILTWKTIVAQVKTAERGTSVGYGLTEKLTRTSRVAVLPIGYYDGYDRKFSRTGKVLIRGKEARVLGRVCMNMIMVDVTDIAGVKPEDEVILIGQQGRGVVSADRLANHLGTINYEIVSRLNPLIPRLMI